MLHIGYFDVHLYGADPVKKITSDTIFADINNIEIKTILFGDIVDRKNCLKKFLEEATNVMKKLMVVLHDFYKTGNHEVNKDEDKATVYQGWGLCHFDMIFNGIEESKKDRMVTPVAGKFSRLWKGTASKARDAGILDFHANLDNVDFQKRFIDYCENFGVEKGCIGGHKHPQEKIVKQIGKYTLVIYPRGRHIVTELN